MNQRLTVGTKMLKRQIRLLDRLQGVLVAAAKTPRGLADLSLPASKSQLMRNANDLDGVANFLSEMRARVDGYGMVEIFKGKDD